MMARHVARRDPRAHWLLLLLGLLLLLAALTVNGLLSGLAGGSGNATARPASDVPAAVGSGGPVLRLDRAEPVSRALPDRTIALTFDDGPDPRWTPQVLDVLRRHGAHATFFVVGARVNEHPELLRRILAEGHEIGSHTFTHADLAEVSPWRRDLELSLTRKAVASATGREVTLLRPPFSSVPTALTGSEYAALRAAASAGHVAVLTDLDTKDWQRPGTDQIVRAATPKRGQGAVVLMHDGGGDRAQTLAALDRLLPALGDQGYRFTTVSAGIDASPSMVEAGTGARLSGTALRWTQTGARWSAEVMNFLLATALVLGVARLAVQVLCAQRHVRRVRRPRRDRPEVRVPVSVIVPAYNEAANIAATVRSLMASAYPALEVIVVDDGSDDGTADIVERMRLRGVRVIRQANAGKPAALNTGIRAARANLLVLVDGDTVFQPDTVHRLVQGFADPSVGAISGNTKVANRRRLLGRWQHLEYVIGFNLDRRMYDVLECMPTIPGAIGAFRREVLLRVGGVPSDTLAEDTDLTMKVLRAGWRVVYEESAIAWTEAPSSLRQLWRQRYRWCYGTMQAMWKHRHALRESGAGGKLGRRGLPYLTVFQIVLPLTAPAVDVFAVYGLLFLPWSTLALAWAGLLLLQAATAAYALRLDRERYGPLWALPFQQLVYRQLMYLVVVQSVVTALVGNRLRWQRMVRTGEAAALVGAGRG
ncbi:cellulose synthase/poly-beta-1,6-N-acetylglucosamine synthase-like glycosyltransferase/peptidoglycan/xylan/chitin deacetylase (PgdA/CDA1 family) [Micromonospora vinacea]|uniref:Cellulose synthase/poly-beta-1,6-N-acetylglucosamine synthase-like glycosyltransferase/peptidoglycan/xylan/chitin deacetylase (PgdA/CDA1 family) n=1 Tax=Micromonospora vinacea TaxID=709878 RepID=A0ABS0JZF3_9ACTN|nr:bifunctional polysaccharide deacetylase/glycosyltransferase family 2 protein [Micromonospora vinacea]MBG6101715.1 cellulose synthase/poly-beta-1,6-N-acetylglucosamine synthase-like glycosyltransferase/peptidoglycan/xylan/chitin deacetylase (PgdA/CDA1 family) [Micromonospora vinacea]